MSKEIVKKLLHLVNGILHTEPFDFLAEGLYWWVMLFFVCPIAAVFSSLTAVYNLFLFAVGKRNPSIEAPCDDRKRSTREIAVVVTGCDSGFGKELAFELVSKGFVVFCGCLLEDSFKQFEGLANDVGKAIPLKMDVTSDEEVTAAFDTVSKWIEAGKKDNKKRYLHGLVNNAGIGISGLMDWTEISDFQKAMDVNFFGIIRCSKTFLPIFKKQAVVASSYRPDDANEDDFYMSNAGRIINIVSAAGMIAPMPMAITYGTSKWAAESLTISMRQELNLLGIKVTGFNPTFHETPIVANVEGQAKRTWEKMPQHLREEYGEDYQQFLMKVPKPFAWKSSIVVNKIVRCLLSKNPPVKVLVGTDAKFAFNFASKLPVWLLLKLVEFNPYVNFPVPALVKNKNCTKSDNKEKTT